MIAEIRSESPPASYLYLSGHVRAQRVIICLWLSIAMATLVMVNAIVVVHVAQQVANGVEFSDRETAMMDWIPDALNLLSIAVRLTAIITFLMWIHRAHGNLPSLGAVNLEFTPGWAVGYFFIPVLNLIWPYLIVSEIWRGSDPAKYNSISGRYLRSSSWLVARWWGLFLLMTFLNYAHRVIYYVPGVPDVFIKANYLSGIGCLVTAISAAVAIKLVRTIDENQEARHALTLRNPVEVGTSIPTGANFFNLNLES